MRLVAPRALGYVRPTAADMMTNLRAVARHLALVAAIVVACGTSAAAQSPVTLPKIGVLWQTSPPPPANPYMALLMANLRELGWEDDKSIVIDYRYGGNHPERLAELARDLAGRKVDVITTIGDLSTRAAQRATTTIPIVAVVGFPVESGFVKALARPGGNITGVAVLADELATKRLDLLKQLIPALTRVALLWDPVTHERQPKTAEAAARALGLTPRIVRAQSAAELAPAFDAALDARAEALVVLVSPMFLANRAQITALAARHRLPAMYFSPVWTESGGLIAYGPSPEEQWQLVARQIDRLLKGASAATLPVQQPTRFELTLNLRTASALGLTIPSGIRQRADRVVE